MPNFPNLDSRGSPGLTWWGRAPSSGDAVRYTRNGRTWWWNGTYWQVLPPDPYFSSVTYLIHFDRPGAIANKGSGGTAVNYIGMAPGSTLIFGGATAENKSAYGNAAQVQALTNAGCSMSTGDFTIEFMYSTATFTTTNTLDFRSAGNSVCPLIFTGNDGSVSYFVSNVTRITGSASAMVASVPAHIAICRIGSVSKLFVAGVQTGSDYADSNNYTSNGFALGNSNTQAGIGNSPTLGSYGELRITKGVGRYAANFSPPTMPFPDY